jgi:PAS domain S-box-containing protein
MERKSPQISQTGATEAELARLTADSQRRLRVYETILASTPDFVYVFSLDYKVMYANDALLKMWGRNRDDAIGKTLLEIGYEPWHAAMHEREIDQVRATKKPIRGVVPFNGTQGRRQYDYIFVPILGADGEVESVAGTTRDITERQEAEERQKFRIRLADTLRPLSDPIEVQAEASRVLGEHLGANRVVYFEIRGDQYVVERDYIAGVAPLVGRYPVAAFGSKLLAVLLDGRTVVETDATLQPDRSAAERAAFAAIHVRGHVDVPLVKDGRFVAGMTVHFCDQRNWTPQEVALIEETSERTWAAVERARVEAALRQSEERRRLALDAAELGTWQIDLATNTFITDERFRIIFSGTTQAMDYERTFAAIHPADRERIRQAAAAAARADDPAPYTEEFRVIHPDGSVRWVFAKGRANYERESQGRFLSLDGTVTDITARKRAEASLRESEQRFRLVADAAPVLIWLSGTDKMCHWFNRPWLAFTGRSMAQEVDNGWVEGVHPNDLERCRHAIDAAFDARAPFSMEYRLRRHDGEFRWLVNNGVPRYGSAGEFEGFIGSCLDVTDYKNAEAGLRDADRRKDEFLATLAHELRNPLAPIRNGLHVIRLAGASGTVEQARSMMERQLTQLVRLVDDLLDMSRVTSGKLELRRARIQLRAVIDAAVETSRSAIEEAGHKLTLTMPADPIWLDGDLTRLAQVVSNLLNNSAKYMRRGGHVRLTAMCENDMAIVSVQDEGIGIPPAMLEKVFEMFTQVDRALEKTTGGLGIGLSLVKGFVEMHGGTIEARSEGEGRGSEFVVRLPVALSAADKVTPDEAQDSDGSPRRRRILIADDNVDSTQWMGKLLEMLRNDVRVANDGLQAVELAESFRPDVILLDIGMPNLNGYEAARRIRAHPAGQGTVLIALTGWGQEDDRRKSFEAGFDHHLVKPVEIAVLTKLLDALSVKA